AVRDTSEQLVLVLAQLRSHRAPLPAPHRARRSSNCSGVSRCSTLARDRRRIERFARLHERTSVVQADPPGYAAATLPARTAFDSTRSMLARRLAPQVASWKWASRYGVTSLPEMPS